jgi:hypothetical protein
MAVYAAPATFSKRPSPLEARLPLTPACPRDGYLGVPHRRQFTGGVRAGVSMGVCAVGDDLGIPVGQQLRVRLQGCVHRRRLRRKIRGV